MKVVTAGEMQRIDAVTIEERGLPGDVLMGYAGKAIADFAIDICGQAERAAIFSGTGNNGGDGFVVAYFLLNEGFSVDIYIAGDLGKVSASSKIYLDLCKNSNISITELREPKNLKKIDLSGYDLLVDAMLGTGFTGSPRGIIKTVIEYINRSTAKVLSVDMPSGLPADGDTPAGEVICADYTVTIGLPKISLVTFPGIRYRGFLEIADIGFPRDLTESDLLSGELIDVAYIRKKMGRELDPEQHKGTAGHLLLVGGFDSMEGAIMMAARSAFEIGAGLVTLVTTPGARQSIAGKIPELITRSLPDFLCSEYSTPLGPNSGMATDTADSFFDAFFDEERTYRAMVIGPGMGRSPLSAGIFTYLMENCSRYGIKRIVIDGDGLYHLAQFLKNRALPGDVSVIITPHFSEAARLAGSTVERIRHNRFYSARELSRKTSAITLLKGPATVVSDGTGSLINTTGNPALAAAGAGDVLAGIIGSLLLDECLLPIDAAGIGAYLHGLSADICVRDQGVEVLKATDLVQNLRKTLSLSS